MRHLWEFELEGHKSCDRNSVWYFVWDSSKREFWKTWFSGSRSILGTWVSDSESFDNRNWVWNLHMDHTVWWEWYHTVRLLSDPYLGTISCNTRKPFRKRRSRKNKVINIFCILPKSHHEVRTITVNESAVSRKLKPFEIISMVFL